MLRAAGRSLVLVVVVVVCCAHAALPPGYEEELYCPAGACLRPKGMPAGFTGSRTMFFECVSDKHVHGDPAGLSRPKAWGFKVGDDVKELLLATGHTTTLCASRSCAEARAATLAHRADDGTSYIPQCTPDGAGYLPRQCFAGHCWCVDPVAGTREGDDDEACAPDEL